MPRRQIGTDLYSALYESELRFIPRGAQTNTFIYEFIKQRYRNLCDDSYLCPHGGGGPEWQHIVREILEQLKKKNMIIHLRHGVWEFI